MVNHTTMNEMAKITGTTFIGMCAVSIDEDRLRIVTVCAKTRHVRTQTEIHFIAPVYSYTK